MNTTYNLILCSQMFADYDQLLCSQLLINYELPSLYSILPIGVKFYDDLLTQKDLIKKENKNKSGVYMFQNKINSNCYVGSGVDLTDRLSDYFSEYYINRLDTQTFLIVKAIKKYTLANFSLTILEYVDSKELAVQREQYWIDTIDPVYNILRFAGSSLGYKHTEESKSLISTKLKGMLRSDEVKLQMSESRLGINNSFFGKKHTEETLEVIKTARANRIKSPVLGIEVEITDLETNITTNYESIRLAAKAINSDIKTILRREKSQSKDGITKPYRNRYNIVIKRSSPE